MQMLRSSSMPVRWTVTRAASAERSAPRTPVEERLAAIFAALLDVPEVGREESFFELGGHSLRAAQAISPIHAELGVELPVRALFEKPDVAALAALVEETARAPQLPLAPRPHADEAPLSSAQERLWFLDRLQPGSPAYNVPLAFHLRGPLAVARLAAALLAVAGRHEVLRATFREIAGRPVQTISPAARFPLAVVDLAGLPANVRPAEAAREFVAEDFGAFLLGEVERVLEDES